MGSEEDGLTCVGWGGEGDRGRPRDGQGGEDLLATRAGREAALLPSKKESGVGRKEAGKRKASQRLRTQKETQLALSLSLPLWQERRKGGGGRRRGGVGKRGGRGTPRVPSPPHPCPRRRGGGEVWEGGLERGRGSRRRGRSGGRGEQKRGAVYRFTPVLLSRQAEEGGRGCGEGNRSLRFASHNSCTPLTFSLTQSGLERDLGEWEEVGRQGEGQAWGKVGMRGAGLRGRFKSRPWQPPWPSQMSAISNF